MDTRQKAERLPALIAERVRGGIVTLAKDPQHMSEPLPDADVFPLPATNGLSAATRNKLLIYIAILSLVNFVISSLPDDRDITHLDRTTASADEVQSATVWTLLVTLPVLGFLLGTLGSLIPYRGWSYGQKYLGVSLLCIIGIHALLLLGSIIGLMLP